MLHDEVDVVDVEFKHNRLTRVEKRTKKLLDDDRVVVIREAVVRLDELLEVLISTCIDVVASLDHVRKIFFSVVTEIPDNVKLVVASIAPELHLATLVLVHVAPLVNPSRRTGLAAFARLAVRARFADVRVAVVVRRHCF